MSTRPASYSSFLQPHFIPSLLLESSTCKLVRGGVNQTVRAGKDVQGINRSADVPVEGQAAKLQCNEAKARRPTGYRAGQTTEGSRAAAAQVGWEEE